MELITDFLDEKETLDEFKELLLEILKNNAKEAERHLMVLVDEAISYAYRAGYTDASRANKEYDFRRFQESYIQELKSQMTETLQTLVNIKK